MRFSPVSPRLLILPRERRPERRQCPSCAGGGEINGVPCGDCKTRGWHDADQRPHGKTSEYDVH